MDFDALKLELIEWLTQLDNSETIQYLKIVKDSREDGKDWWDDLTVEQKQGIQRGLEDVDNGRVISHDEVKRKYGL